MKTAIIFVSFIIAASSTLLLDNRIPKINEGPIDTTTIDPIIKIREESQAEIEKAEKLNKGVEKMLEIVDIMGQLDSYVSEKTKHMLKKLATLAEDDEDTPIPIQSK